MTDFYSVLRNALDRVGAVDDAGARDRVYAHVREGMVRRLQRQDPPLAEDVIADRIDDFEAAVARIEEEVAESVFAEAEADFEPEPHPQPAYAGDWNPPHPPAEEPQSAPTAGDTASAPESIWGSAAIDLAWDETTAQWQDPDGRPSEPRLPIGGWEERLGFALSDDRRSHHGTEDIGSYGEPDEEDEPPAAPRPERRNRFSRMRRRRPAGPAAVAPAPSPEPEPPQKRRWRLPRWRAEAAVAAEPASRYAPVPDVDLSEPATPGVRPRRPLSRSAPAERAMFYLEDRTLQADAVAIVAAAREARVIDVEFEEDDPDFHHPADAPPTRRRPYRRTGAPRAAAAAVLSDEAEGPERNRAGRVLTIAISVLALIVAVWCGYVFLPLIVGSNEAASPAAVATQPAAVAAAPADGTIALFTGEDPTIFEGGPDNPVRYETDDTGGYVRLASSTTGGFRAIVGPGVAERLGGHDVRLIMEVRAAPTRPSSTLRIGYLRGTRLLEWRTIGLGTEFETATLEWDVPPGGTAADAFIIEPGIPGDGTALDIRSLRLQVLD
ncbi:MAG: hypothetical protein AB7O56_01635 [Bauldia sp.]